MKKYVSMLGLYFVSSSTFATVYTGSLNVQVFDDFLQKKSTVVYQLKVDNKMYQLNIPANVDTSRLLTGVDADVEGVVSKQTTNSPQINVNSINIRDNSLHTIIPSSPRRILSLLVNFTNKKVTDTVSETALNNLLYTASDSMANNYSRSSFNQVTFIPDANKDGNPDIYTINLNYAAENCESLRWADDAVKQAKKSGINTSGYEHVMFVLPQDTGCSWGGTGQVGCQGSACYTWIIGNNPMSAYAKGVYAHEIGHNLGLYHSAIDADNNGTAENDYGDATCFMGANFSYFTELNAPHRDQLEWYKKYPNSIKTITSSGTYTLSPLELGPESDQVITLKFLKKDSSQYYYLSYRVNKGPFGNGASSNVNKVSIHKASSAKTTYFIQALDTEERFIDNANNIEVRVLAITGDSATVRITLDGMLDQLTSSVFYGDDNTGRVGYEDWDVNNWKGNCAPNTETVGLSTSADKNARANSIACLSTYPSNATGQFKNVRGLEKSDDRGYSRNGDWDPQYYKWECGLNEYVSGFSQSIYSPNPLHKIRCAAGKFTNGGINSCKTFLVTGRDDRGSTIGGNWDPNNNKGQCADGQIVFGVSVDMSYRPHKILCCNK